MIYDVIIVGTGFGATIAASRLARLKKKVLMLERGTWWITPEKLGKPPAAPPPPKKAKMPIADWAKERNQTVQYWPRPEHKEGLLDLFASIRHDANPRGLYNYRMFDQAHVLSASGVGGGSLIYSNVTLRPEEEVLADLRPHGLELGDAEYINAREWMKGHRGRLQQVVTKIPLPGPDGESVEESGARLGSLGPDKDYLYLDRSRALRDAVYGSFKELAPKLGMKVPTNEEEAKAFWHPLDLAITEYDNRDASNNDAAAKVRTFCERQGRCFLGCLPAARHTLNKTLYSMFLSEPDNFDVTLLPLSEVREVKKVAGGYTVVYHDHRTRSEATATGKTLILAGGTLGTTEILLRSRENGLALSDKVGTRFSTNGDFGAFVLNTKNAVYSNRGPINTSHVKLKYDGSHINVEDCSIPSMFAALSHTALGVLDNFIRRDLFKAQMHLSWMTKALPDLRDLLPHLPDTTDPTAYRTEAEMVSNLFFFNVMGQDEATGRFSLDDDALDLTWDAPVADQPIFRKIEEVLQAFTRAMGGEYVPFPLWRGFADRKLIVVHPLGGCPIGPTRADGAVNAWGQVFDAGKADPTAVHEGLFVLDGSSIPGALAVNPTLTITAQVLRSLDKFYPRGDGQEAAEVLTGPEPVEGL